MKVLIVLLLIGSVLLSGCTGSLREDVDNHEERITILEDEVFAEIFYYDWDYSHGFNRESNSVYAKYLFEVTNNYSEPIILEKGGWRQGEKDGINLFDYAGKFCSLEDLPNRVDSGETVLAEVDCFAWCSLDKVVPHMFSISFRFRDSNVLVQHADWTGELETSFRLDLYEFRQSFIDRCING